MASGLKKHLSPIMARQLHIFICVILLSSVNCLTEYFKWTKATADGIPKEAFQTGIITDDKISKVYVIRITRDGTSYLGKLIDPGESGKPEASILIDKKEETVTNEPFEVLVVTREGVNKLRWLPYSGGLLPNNVISAGTGKYNEKKIICRGLHKGNTDLAKAIIPGEIVPSLGYCHTVMKEHAFHMDYQVLTQD